MHYFAKDGNYGDADGLVVVDTANWLVADWALIEQASDEHKSAVAKEIDEEFLD